MKVCTLSLSAFENRLRAGLV